LLHTQVAGGAGACEVGPVRRSHKRVLTLAGACSALLVTSPAAPAAPRYQAGAVLEQTVIARTQPRLTAHAVQRVWAYTPFSRTEAVLPVIDRASDRNGGEWLHVRMPDRPNNATGWIPAVRVREVRLRWRIVVDLSRRTATTYRLGRRARRDRVVIGKPSTPTPLGHFFVVDRARLTTWWARGTIALMTSAYSDVFQVTREDPGEIGLHSRGVLSDPLGSAASHGCVRFDSRAIAWLAKRIPNGTPIDVRR
jgi:lipoprotein-anchoring transpeptidase ErfK/SrfK